MVHTKNVKGNITHFNYISIKLRDKMEKKKKGHYTFEQFVQDLGDSP